MAYISALKYHQPNSVLINGWAVHGAEVAIGCVYVCVLLGHVEAGYAPIEPSTPLKMNKSLTK